MLKKILVTGSVIVAVVAIAFAAFVGYASAQTPQPGGGPAVNGVQGFGPGQMMGGRGNSTEGYQGYGPGMMNRGNYAQGTQGYGPGTMGRRGGQGFAQGEGPLHTYMVAAFAEALNLTPEALQAELDAGKTMYDVAAENGYTAEQFTELMTSARTTALGQAVAAGDITQQQADWMQQRWEVQAENGFGPGNCPMRDADDLP